MEETNLGDLGIDCTISLQLILRKQFWRVPSGFRWHKYKQLVERVHECKTGVACTVQSQCSWTLIFKTSTFRDHFCYIISTFLFDCFIQIGMRPRGCRVGLPSPPIATSFSAQLRCLLHEVTFIYHRIT